MDLFKSILNLSLNKVQSFGNLGSSNNGLSIEIISSKTHGQVSSLSSTSALNRKNDKILIYGHHVKIKTLDYSQDSIRNLSSASLKDIKYVQPLSLSSNPSISEDNIASSGFISESTEKPKIQVVKKSNYWQILEDCRIQKVKFTDTIFPANDNSLGSKNYVISQSNYNGWKRITEVVKNPVFVKNFDPTDPIQGQIGNCYFLSSVATLAKDYPGFFEQIFASHKISEEGIYMARFYVEGILVEVVVDDYIPVDKNGLSLYAKPTSDNQIWPMILQKCWAKLFKSYQRTDSGSPHQVFYALTGSPYGIKICDKLPEQSQKQQFIKLFKFQKKGSLFSCNTYHAKEQDHFFKKGLASFHAYSVIELIIDPICIVKLRNPWGFNQGSKNGYYYNWKVKLPKIYGPQNYDRIIEKLQKDYKVDLFGPQTDGIFYMHFDEFMKYFVSITVCPIYKDLNILTHRGIFFKNKPQFFYFDLPKPGQVIVSMSQMFWKLQASQTDETHPYTVTSLILAKQVKRKQNSMLKKFQSADSQNNLQMKDSQSLRISDKSVEKNISQISQSQKGDEEVYYQFIAARSNNSGTPFNFVTIEQKIFQAGRYVIFAQVNSISTQMKKDCSITVYCEDSCFPQQIRDLDQLYPHLKPKNLFESIKKISSQTDIQTKWLQEVLLDKVMNNPNQDRKKIQDYTTEVKRKLSDEQFEKLEDSKPSLVESWFVFKTNSVIFYQKMGGYGYFVCHLSETHPYTESFIFPEKQFNRRCIQFVNSNAIRENGTLRMDVNPGQTKIIILKINLPFGKNGEQLRAKYPEYDFASSPPLPSKKSISSSQKISAGSQTTLTSLSKLPIF